MAKISPFEVVKRTSVPVLVGLLVVIIATEVMVPGSSSCWRLILSFRPDTHHTPHPAFKPHHCRMSMLKHLIRPTSEISI
jgi:hypothetical protein